MDKKRKKTVYSTNKKKNVQDEIISHDLNLEIADELLIHDEYIPEYFAWLDVDTQRNKVDEIEKITNEEDI